MIHNEPRPLTDDEWDGLRDMLYMRGSAITIETIIDRRLPGVLSRLLVSCCEDNIDEDGDGSETIDWRGVRRDYAASLPAPQS